MKTNAFAARICIAAAAALAFANCGKNEEAAQAPEAQEEANIEDRAAVPMETEDVEASELTKVSSQGAAVEQAKGVFAQAAKGDPEAVFLARCQYCHIQLGPGTITLARRLGDERALLADRTDLTEDYVKAVVRNGLNTMPALTRVEISDEELELIAEYLTRNNETAPQ